MAVSFLYPATAIEQGGLGGEHLAAVFIGLTLHGIGLASIGLVCSAFTSSQLVAAVSAWAAAFLLWDLSWASGFVGDRIAGPAGGSLDPAALLSFAGGGSRSRTWSTSRDRAGLAWRALFSSDLRRVGG
jgi:hypothetical protein